MYNSIVFSISQNWATITIINFRLLSSLQIETCTHEVRDFTIKNSKSSPWPEGALQWMKRFPQFSFTHLLFVRLFQRPFSPETGQHWDCQLQLWAGTNSRGLRPEPLMMILNKEKMGGRPAPHKERKHASCPPESSSQNLGCWQEKEVHMYMTEVYVLDAETHYFLVRVVTDNSVPQIVKNNARCSMNQSS